MRVLKAVIPLLLSSATLAAQGRAGTATTLTASPNPALTGQTVTLRATVTSSGGIGGTPGGTVRFGSLGNAALVNGVATLAVSSLSVGTHYITAHYSGATGFRPSNSARLAQVVLPRAPTTTVVTTSRSPAPSGEPVTFTATVTSPGFTPTGSIGFIIDGATANAAVLLTGGVATFTTSVLAVGSHTISASYGGSASFTPSASASITQVVDPANALSITPTPVDFGQVVVGVTSPVLTVTLTNTGSVATGPLSLTNSTGDAGDFLGTATNCPSTTVGGLAAGASCAFAFTFTPTTTGSRTRSLTISATPGGSATITLVGTGIPVPRAVLALSPASFDFGSVGVGFSSSVTVFTLTNTGTGPSGPLTLGGLQGANPGDFVGDLASTTCSSGGLAVGASCAIGLLFKPQAVGARSAIFGLAASPGGNVTATLTGTGLVTQLLAVSPESYDFGAADIGTTTAPQRFVISNTGVVATGPLISPGLEGANSLSFSGAPGTCADVVPVGLAPGASCDFFLTFSPRVAGPNTAALNFTATPGGSATIQLTGSGNAPAHLTVTPSTQDFGSTGIGIPSAPQTFTFTNDGGTATGPFGGTGGLGGANPADFAGVSTTCDPGGLAAHASCVMVLTFVPTALGPRSALLGLSTAGGTAIATLSGTGVVAQLLSVSPSSFDFGTVNPGTTSAPHRFTITNNGSVATGPFVSRGLEGANPEAFAGVGATSTCDDIGAVGLAAGASCDIDISFTPPVDGSYSASLTFSATPGGAVTIQLSGTGIFQLAAILISPRTWDFGAVLVGQDALKWFTVTNASPSPVQILAQGFLTPVPVPGFGLDPFGTCINIFMVDPGATCTIGIHFKPESPGSVSQTLSVVATGDLTASAALTATGTLPVLAITPTAHDFGSVILGQTSAPVAFSINLNFFGSISAASVGVTGPALASYVVPEAVACSEDLVHPGQRSCFVSISFAPTGPGPQPATFMARIQSDDGTTYTATSDLTGNGVAPIVLSVAPSSRDFGSVIVGDASPGVNFTVTNPSTSKLTLDPITVTGTNPADFVVGPGKLSCANILEPGASCDFDVGFTPKDVGARAASVTISAGPATLGTTVALTGTGAPALTIAPSSQDFGSILLGQSSAALGFTVTNVGPVSILINNFVVAGQFNDFTVAPGTCGPALPTGGSCAFTVTFTPTALGARAATITAVGTGGTPTVSATLTGTGTDQPPVALRIAPDTFQFTSIPVGSTSPPATFTVTNLLAVRTGIITTFALDGVNTTDYLIAQGTCGGATLDPGGSCTFSVTFAPHNGGGHRTTLTVRTSVGETGTTQLRGFGIVSAVLAVTPASQDFGFVFLGQSNVVTFTVTNSAGNVGAVLDFTFGGPNSSDFFPIVDGYTCVYFGQLLAPGASCTIGIIFQPQVYGPRSATFTVTDIGGLGSSTATATLAGGVTPGGVLTISPTSKNFGIVPVGFFSLPTEFIVTNVGSTIAVLSGVAITGQAAPNYRLEPGTFCGPFLEVGASCSIVVSFAPLQTGPLPATLLVSYDAGTVSASLTGTGGPPSSAIRAGSAVTTGTIELTPFTPADATRDLLGVPTLSPARRNYLDMLGNHDGSYDLGDLLAFLDRHHVAVSPALLRAAEHHKERVP